MGKICNPPMSALETRIPPPFVALAIAVLMWAAGQGVAGDGPSWRGWMAGVLIALGLALDIPSVVRFRAAGTTVNPLAPQRVARLVTGGAYRFTRNPMYLGMVLILCGIAVWLGGWVVWLGPSVFVAFITRFQILPEERAMAAKFGADYAAYRGRVRRWI
jgi:protein-S-isoprenylcysteine O-methyltransferase Ste14